MGTLYWHHCSYSTGPDSEIFVRILFVANNCYVILENGLGHENGHEIE